MRLVRRTITLSNSRQPDLSPYEATALVDTDALHLCIPKHVALQLKLEELQKREVITACGQKHLCSYVGPVEVTFGSRRYFTGALVFGEEVLLGAVPMEDMDLIVHPPRGRSSPIPRARTSRSPW